MIQAISFDVGETLLRPYPSFEAVVRRCCEARGVAWPSGAEARLVAQLDAHFAEVRRRGVAYSTDDAVSRQTWTELYRRFLSSEGAAPHQVEALVEEVYRTFLEPTSYRLFDDALPALEEARRRGYRVGVLSNWEGWLPRLLAHARVDHLLDFAVISGHVGCEKPDPRIFAAAVAAVGVPADQILHVGDSPSSDVAGATAAGLQAVLLDRFDRYAGLDIPRIRGLTELVAYAERLARGAPP